MSLRAHSAGEALDNILTAAESVYKQAEDAGEAATKVSAAATELVEAVDSVSAVIEENTAATEQMAANSSELTQAVENIASVSEENSALRRRSLCLNRGSARPGGASLLLRCLPHGNGTGTPESRRSVLAQNKRKARSLSGNVVMKEYISSPGVGMRCYLDQWR